MSESNFINAAQNGDLNTVQSLVEEVNINSKDERGYTALNAAATNKRLDVVRFLVARKDVDVNLESVCTKDDNESDALSLSWPLHHSPFSPFNHTCCSALFMTTSFPLLVTLCLLFNYRWVLSFSPLWYLSKPHQYLLSLLQNDGDSPLHNAARVGFAATVTVLLSNGADVNQANNNGQKPIDIAYNQIIKDMLIAHTNKQPPQQPPPDQAPSSGQAVSTMINESQWFQAAEKGRLAVIQHGINDKIDINCRNSHGCTAVHLAAGKCHLQLLKYLITLHADLSITSVSANDVNLAFSYPYPTTTYLLIYVA